MQSLQKQEDLNPGRPEDCDELWQWLHRLKPSKWMKSIVDPVKIVNKSSLFCAAFMLYWFLGALMDGPAAVLSWATAMPISPHFNAPYLSTSISDFWSKRWNLTVGNVLRSLCYDPIHEGTSFCRRVIQSGPYELHIWEFSWVAYESLCTLCSTKPVLEWNCSFWLCKGFKAPIWEGKTSLISMWIEFPMSSLTIQVALMDQAKAMGFPEPEAALQFVGLSLSADVCMSSWCGEKHNPIICSLVLVSAI